MIASETKHWSCFIFGETLHKENALRLKAFAEKLLSFSHPEKYTQRMHTYHSCMSRPRLSIEEKRMKRAEYMRTRMQYCDVCDRLYSMGYIYIAM